MFRRHRLCVPSALLIVSSLAAQSCPPSSCGTALNATFLSGTWTAAGSPYCINPQNSTVTVGSLAIGPGVTVLVAQGTTIEVAGILTVNGTAAAPVLFTSKDATPWKGLRFVGPQAPSTLAWCRIEKASESGVRIAESSPAFSHCVIAQNSTPQQGGGIHIANTLATAGSPTFEDCEIADNSSASHGGGVRANLVAGTTLFLTRCRIERNTAHPAGNVAGQFVGGGLYLVGDSVLTNCMIRDNKVRSPQPCNGTLARGGGVYVDTGVVELRNCVVTRNIADGVNWTCSSYSYGGGICVQGTATLHAANSFITCNTIANSNYAAGGGIYLEGSATVELVNCTVARNAYAPLYRSAGTLSLANTIVWFHTLSIAGAYTATWSNIQGTAAGLCGAGNCDQNPLFVGTACGAQDFLIPPYSPCVDAGDPGPAFDDATLPLPAGPPHGTLRNDIGAYGGPLGSSFAPPCVTSGGANPYGIITTPGNTLRLSWTPGPAGTPHLGALVATNAAPGAAGWIAVNTAAANTILCSSTVLISTAPPTLLLAPIAFDQAGTFTVPGDLQQPGILPFVAHIQVLSETPLALSNGIEVFCSL